MPNKKTLIKKALEDDDFKVQTKGCAGAYFFSC